jgi:hypothetical protein
MGEGIKFKIEDVRAGATAIKADGEKFRTQIQPKLADLVLPQPAFPPLAIGLHETYEHARSALNDVTGALAEAMTSIGGALDAVATFYEGVERKHAAELAALE